MALTRLTRKVRRAVDGLMRNGLVITIYPNNTIGVKELKRRKEYTLPLATIYRLAVQADLEAKRIERQKKRDGGRRLVKRGLL